MNFAEFSKRLVLVLALAGICLPQPLLAAAPATPDTAVVDVALDDGGALQGQVVDPQGNPQANTPVALLAGEQELGMARTDQTGQFAFRGLRGGVYQLAAADSQGAVRLWAPHTAPPSAQRGVMLVTGQGLVRGQALQNLGGFVSHPWVTAGIIATAIAVPVAIHNANRSDGPHSP